MKRSLIILLSSVLFLLAACRSGEPELRDTFAADVAVSGGGFDCTARVNCSPDGVTVRLLSPDSVAGVSYVYQGGELTTSCGELSTVTGSGSLPPGAAPSLLCDTLSRLSEAAYEGSDSGGDAYRLHLSAGDVTIVCREGVPRTITATFSPYRIALTPRSE